MDKRFLKLFNLSEDEAIKRLQTPLEQLEDPSDRYVAAAHLANFDSDRSIQALMEAVKTCDDQLYNRIARRKAIESLGKLKVRAAIDVIRPCLSDPDCYTVELAVWALGEIGTDDQGILEEIANNLDRERQMYRVIIQTLAKLEYAPAVNKIRPFTKSDDPCIVSAAYGALAQLSGNEEGLESVVGFLSSQNVNARRGSIQDLIDAHYYKAIPEIAKTPVSLVFRLRAIRLLAEKGIEEGKITFAEIQPYLEQVIQDNPHSLNLVHQYEEKPTLAYLMRELYHTDFGHCYLASKTLLESYPTEAPDGLMATYEEEAHNDYGAHYHVMKLFGWLKYEPAYDILVEALNNQAPQFQKSRGGAAFALGKLGNTAAIPLLKESVKSPIFDLKYASLLALENLGDMTVSETLKDDTDRLIRARVN